MNPHPEQDWSGGGRELRGGGHLDESVYCVTCGTIFVSNTADYRGCPSCVNREAIEDLQERVGELRERVDALAETDEDVAEHIVDTHTTLQEAVDDLERRVDRAERDIDLIDR